ncbi:MAG: DUF2894 domain-containing protein [Deltaproteobacteria bacterium]|nr:DUF2894 domain-containing protein [Deltaproteobacteria bacterium]
MNIDAALQEAKENGVSLVDPVEFSYVQTLFERGASLPAGAKDVLWRKANARLASLVTLHEKHRAMAEKSLTRLASFDEEYAEEIKRQYGEASHAVIERVLELVDGDEEKQKKFRIACERLSRIVQGAKNSGLAGAAVYLREADALLGKKLRLNFVEQAHRLANHLELLRLDAELKEPRATLSLSRMKSKVNEEAGLYNPEVLVTRVLSELSLASPEASWALLDWARDYAQLAQMLGDEGA